MECLLIMFAPVAIIIIIMTLNAISTNSKTKDFKNELQQKYGICTLEIKPLEPLGEASLSLSIKDYVLVYESHKIVIINNKEIKFDEILDFRVNDNKSYKATTSTGSAVGRGIVGGALFGGVGALAGIGTASKNIEQEGAIWNIHITLKSFSEPLITYSTRDENAAHKLVSVLTLIIDNNQ